jgi:peptide/nickel transport system substrate-binding protein
MFYYNLTEANAKPQPQLATAYAWNADGTQLTITTRSGVKWTDGSKFSAADVAYTVNLVQHTPALNTNGITATAKATGPNTVVLTFPTTSFVDEANVLGNLPIVPEHIWSKVANPTTDINKKPVGTGPYELKSFTPQSYSLQKNPHYWGTGGPKISTVRYITLSDADAASAALLSGKVDWMSSYLPGLKTLLKNHKDIQYVNTPANTTVLQACVNPTLGCSGPQTDVAVRQAIYYAVDRTQLNNLAEGGFGSIGSPTVLLSDRDRNWITDPSLVTSPAHSDVSKATSILQTAGYTKNADGYYAKDGTPITLTVDVISGYSDYISAVSTMTTELKAAGIQLKENQVSVNEYSNDTTNGKYELGISNFGASVSTNPYFEYWQYYGSENTAKVGQPSKGNSARYENPTVDAALKAAAASNDPTVQKAQYAIIQKEIATDMPYISLFVTPTLTEFNNTRVVGWPTNSNKYAFPAAWKNWDNGIVLRKISPRS